MSIFLLPYAKSNPNLYVAPFTILEVATDNDKT